MLHTNTPNSHCQFAIASGDITPPVGMYHRMWGAATHDRSEGVHRPLLATVVILRPAAGGTGSQAADYRGEQLVLVALDHCLFGGPEMDFVLGEISSGTGVDRTQIVVAFSHTHGAGLLHFDRQTLPGGEQIPNYLRTMSARVAELYRQAAQQVQSATLTYGSGRCDLAVNRDFWDAESKQFVCGYNPGIAADDTVLVARVTNHDGTLLASFVNYACHPTTLAWQNRLVSPDYPGAMREVIEQATDAPCVFLQGASGELGPKEGYVGDVAVADRNGRQLGYAALSTLTALPPPATRFEYTGPVVSGATLGTWKHAPLPVSENSVLGIWKWKKWNVPLAYRDNLPTLEEARAAEARWKAEETAAVKASDESKARDCRAMVERNTRLIARLSALPVGKEYPLEVSLLRIGNAVWLSVPGEHYSLLQTDLRARFGDTPLMITTIANGWGPSYLPTADIYGRGIYQESIALLAPGCLEKLIAAIAQELSDLLK